MITVPSLSHHTYGFLRNAGSVTEGNNAVFTVTMNGTISSNQTIWYSTFAGTASAAALTG